MNTEKYIATGERIDRHKKTIKKISHFARKVILFSYISLFCIYGDMYIGTGGADNSMTLFGVQIFGITQQNFLIFLLIANIYCLAKFAYFVIREGIIADSWSLFRDTMPKRLHLYSMRHITGIIRISKRSIIKPKNPMHEQIYGTGGENPESLALEKISEVQREIIDNGGSSYFRIS